MVLGKNVAIFIGNGAEIQPLEKDRKSPVFKLYFIVLVVRQVVQEENNILQVDLSKPPDDDIADDRPVSVRDALVFLELANFESELSVPGPKGQCHLRLF